MTSAQPPSPRPVRVGVVQFVVPHYRVPLFNRLARTPGIELVVHSETDNVIDSLRPALQHAEFRNEPAPMRRFGPFWSQPAWLECCRSGRYDVLVGSWNARLIQLFPGLVAARRSGTKVLLWGHGYGKKERMVTRRIRNRALSMASGCLLYSRGAEAELRADGFPPEKLHVILNALDRAPIAAATQSWRTSPARLEAFRAEQGIAGRDLLLFVSRVEPSKRLGLLLWAFAAVLRSRPSAKLAIVGGGSALADTDKVARELGVADSVVFTGPIYDEERLAPWMLSARCAIFPADVGLGLLHAFSYGVPVITNDAPALHGPEIEALRAGVNGDCFKLGDSDDLALTIDRLLSDEPRRAAMSKAALETVTAESGYSIDGMVAGFLRAIAACRTETSPT